MARRLTLHPKKPVHNGDDPVLLVGPHEGRDLGELSREVRAVARRHAAAHDDGHRTGARGGLLGQLNRGLDALGGGGGEERACVHEHEVGACRGVHLLIATRVQKRAHAVGVHLVLGAAEGDVEELAEGHGAGVPRIGRW